MRKKVGLIILTLFVLFSVSLAWGETVSTLLEKGIFAEDTKGDLDEAINIYERIISEHKDQRSYIARAYYRLGSCYLKKGEEEKAKKAFQDLLANFPEQDELTSEAKAQLASLGVADNDEKEDNLFNEPLEIGPAPWIAGETCQYNLKSMAGMEIGKQIWVVDEVQNGDKNLWRVEQYYAVMLSDFQQFSRVDAKMENFVPVRGRTKNNLGDFQAVYEPGFVELESNVSGQKSKKSFPLYNTVYDNEQAIYLIRRLPLDLSYKAAFHIFVVQTGVVFPARLEIKKREKISVPAGEFDSYRLEIVGFKDGIKALQHTMWYSADDRKILLKYDSGQAIIELEDVLQKHRGQLSVFKDDDVGMSITAPGNWHFLKNTLFQSTYKLLLQILPPELKSWGTFVVSVRTERMWSARAVAETDIDFLKGYFKNYTVRPESWESIEISGLPSSTFIADYEDKGKNMVEYRTYIIGKSHVFRFVFRIEAKNFEANKPEFDMIIQSFTNT